MTEEQCAETYNILANLLRRSNLGWVMDQVDADVRVGKLIEKPIREISARYPTRGVAFELVEMPEPQRRGRAGSIRQRVEYSHRERLRVLIEAIEHAVLHTADLVEAALKLMADTRPSLQIVFEPDGSNERPFSVDQVDIHSRRQFQNDLRLALNQLKAQIDAP
jgi:hypothetical protein